MIRRRANDGFLLVPQAQHARLAGDIARNFGGALAAPGKPDELGWALKAHAAGFDAFDAKPPLNAAGLPMNCDEIPVISLLDGWRRSSELAATSSPYQAMLVSLLSLQRSAAIATSARSMRENFATNKHQQAEIELQATLRPQIALRNDVPLRNGLPDGNVTLTPDEQAFIYDYRLMLLAIQLALELCLHRRAIGELSPTPAKPGGDKLTIGYRSADGIECTLAPFPLTQPLDLQVSARLVPSRPFEHELELHELLETTPAQTLPIRLRPGE